MAGRITCGKCGYIADSEELVVPDMLYLKEPTRGGILFAFDAEHLRVLVDFFLSRDRNPLAFPQKYQHALNNMGGGLLSKKNLVSVLKALSNMNQRMMDEMQRLIEADEARLKETGAGLGDDQTKLSATKSPHVEG